MARVNPGAGTGEIQRGGEAGTKPYYLLRPLSRFSSKRKQPTRPGVYLQDNSAARRLGSGSDGARCSARASGPRRANSTGVPAAGARGSPGPCPVDAPPHWLISPRFPRPTSPPAPAVLGLCRPSASLAPVERPQLCLRLLRPRRERGAQPRSRDACERLAPQALQRNGLRLPPPWPGASRACLLVLIPGPAPLSPSRRLQQPFASCGVFLFFPLLGSIKGGSVIEM